MHDGYVSVIVFAVRWMTRQIALDIDDRDSYVNMSIKETLTLVVFFACLLACKSRESRLTLVRAYVGSLHY